MSQKTLTREETDRRCTGKIMSQKTLYREETDRQCTGKITLQETLFRGCNDKLGYGIRRSICTLDDSCDFNLLSQNLELFLPLRLID